ncbi:hypothetical protein DOZ80_19145 [Pseudomonas fluorescens]|uniref:Uncharacterized protein n=1 Tax=Pseudomonas fluorescens TaxID=294 RepID=A0A327MWJ9_PSEFL|nr:hypothetical protein DOZ80_19145 [Pseudomonas fluorescens]
MPTAIFEIGKEPCGSWLASDSGLTVNKDVGCADLIAGKPAPTVIAFHIREMWGQTYCAAA